MPNTRSFHYGWIIVAVGFLVIFSCIGLGRYAYTMLIPSMQHSLALSYDKMGFISTANFCGYLAAVILAPSLIRRFKLRILISCGLLLITLALLLLSQSHGFWPPLVLYLLVGMGTGFANIPTMALISHWFRSKMRGRAAGLMIAGNGAAIMLAGILVPALNQGFGENGWRIAWFMLGITALLVTLVTAWLVRNYPADIGLEPLGKVDTVSAPNLVQDEQKGDGVLLVKLGLLYMAFGATFMVYGTFIVATMVKELGFTEAKAGMYWSWVGFCSLFSGLIFGILSDRFGRKHGLALVFALQACSYALAGMKVTGIGLVISIILYGLAVFAIPAIMAAAVGDYLGVSRAASAFAAITVFFAAGQTIGPAAAGMLAKASGSFSSSYLCAAVITLIACCFSFLLPEPRNLH